MEDVAKYIYSSTIYEEVGKISPVPQSPDVHRHAERSSSHRSLSSPPNSSGSVPAERLHLLNWILATHHRFLFTSFSDPHSFNPDPDPA
jgi:hypothetical protein